MRDSKKAKITTQLIATPTERFNQVAESYQVKTPRQLKMRLLWQHVLWLVEMTMHPGPESARMLAQARTKWNLAEMEEQRQDSLKEK